MSEEQAQITEEQLMEMANWVNQELYAAMDDPARDVVWQNNIDFVTYIMLARRMAAKGWSPEELATLAQEHAADQMRHLDEEGAAQE